MFVQIGGGCHIPPETLHPCSDSYENVETGEKVVLCSTLERHSTMPRTVASPADLYVLNGVRRRKNRA